MLNHCGSEASVLIIVEVQPKHSRTGLHEERGRWIQEFWSKVLQKIPSIHGHRLLWSQLLFIYRSDDVDFVEAQLAETLQECRSEHLKSLCVLSIVGGGTKEKAKEIDRMLNGFKEWNFGDTSLFKHWLLDGEQFQKLRL